MSPSPATPTISNKDSRRTKKAKKTQDSLGVSDALARLENISSTINRNVQEDEFYFFGLNVASQLRKLPLHEALDVQTEIQKSLTMARSRHILSNLSTIRVYPAESENCINFNVNATSSTPPQDAPSIIECTDNDADMLNVQSQQENMSNLLRDAWILS